LRHHSLLYHRRLLFPHTRPYFFRSPQLSWGIEFGIQDLNAEIANLSTPSMKEIVFVIVLIDWICEAVESLQKILLKDIFSGFTCKNEEDIEKSKKYFKAIRSFVVAHPLNTDRHKDYGLDGDFICVDVRMKTSKIVSEASHSSDWFHLDFNGLQENAKNTPSDFVLYTYSKKMDGMQFFKYIGANFSDLYCVAKLQIEKLYALDKYLASVSRKKLEVVK
jgi:hypothetical protein